MLWLSRINTQLNRKRVMVRVDLNVPIKNGKLLDSTRIKALRATLHKLSAHKAKIVLLSHYKNPKGKVVPEYAMSHLKPFLEIILEQPVTYIDTCYGEKIQQTMTESNDIILLENIRFYPGEESNDPALAQTIAHNMDIYINEAFSCCHREHCSIMQLPKLLPAIGGLHLEQELKNLDYALSQMEAPILVILGGSKVSAKLHYIEKLQAMADHTFVGGDCSDIALAKTTLQAIDVLCASSADATEAILSSAGAIPRHMRTFDIGPRTISMLKELISASKTVIWNGPLGYIENPLFSQGSKEIAQFLSASQEKIVIIGGGETLSIMKDNDNITHKSTAGGALLHYITYRQLPGIEALKHGRTFEV